MENEHDRTELEEAVLPLVEERLEVAKRTVEGRKVTVETRPVTRTENISEPVTRETLTVERVPIGKVVESMPETTEADDLVIIPVVEERVKVTKELFLVEEVHLRRERDTAAHDQAVELRGTEVDISEEPA